MGIPSTLKQLGGCPLGSYWPTPMSLDESLGIRVNGEHRRVPGGISVAEMVNGLGLDPLRVAVERNLEILPRSQIGNVCVEDGDDYEIVHFVGGG
jgi:thiamine biosynthesis protein ThiS